TPVQVKIVESSPAADPVSRTRLVKLDLPPGSTTPEGGIARSGQFARVQWPLSEVEMLTVPAAAVSLYGQMERVFVVQDGRAQLRIIRSGMEADGALQVLSGLEPGETVVLNPPASLRSAQQVEAR